MLLASRRCWILWMQHPAPLVPRQVLLGRWNCALVALKVLRPECMQHASSAALADLRREAEMLQAMHHPCILTLYGICLDCEPVRLQIHCLIIQCG